MLMRGSATTSGGLVEDSFLLLDIPKRVIATGFFIDSLIVDY